MLHTSMRNYAASHLAHPVKSSRLIPARTAASRAPEITAHQAYTRRRMLLVEPAFPACAERSVCRYSLHINPAAGGSFCQGREAVQSSPVSSGKLSNQRVQKASFLCSLQHEAEPAAVPTPAVCLEPAGDETQITSRSAGAQQARMPVTAFSTHPPSAGTSPSPLCRYPLFAFQVTGPLRWHLLVPCTQLKPLYTPAAVMPTSWLWRERTPHRFPTWSRHRSCRRTSGGLSPGQRSRRTATASRRGRG